MDKNENGLGCEIVKAINIGKYELIDEYRENYYWLNVDIGYGWSFSNLEVGESQEYSNLNPDGSTRKQENCFRNIKIGDKIVAYESGNTKAITAICEVIKKRDDSNETIVEFVKKTDFKKFLTLKEMKVKDELIDCKIVRGHMGTLIKLEKKYFYIIKGILEDINSMSNYIKEFEKSVNESLNISDKERRRRLGDSTNNMPEKTERTSSVFKRNPDVVAEVLIRAKGKCEKCEKQAPFNRASDGTPYLEVHHKIWLACGGKDTIDNTIAVCPNCHRELHFG